MVKTDVRILLDLYGAGYFDPCKISFTKNAEIKIYALQEK